MRRRWLAYNNPGGYHRFRFAHQGGRGRGAEHGASVTNSTEGTMIELPNSNAFFSRSWPVQVTGGECHPWDYQAGAVLAVKSMIIYGLKDNWVEDPVS